MKRVAIILSTIMLSLLFTGCAPGPIHMARCVLWMDADTEDYRKFPAREIENAPPPFIFDKRIDDSLPGVFQDIAYKGNKKIGNLDEFLESTETTAFLIIKEDTILYEKYFNGYTRDSINTSFSVAKSFDSALIGIAIDEGHIKNVDEPITNYIPELKTNGFDAVTIRHLISMSSGIRYHENNTPWGDNAKTYYYPDLRKLALGVEIEEPPGRHFNYCNYNPLLVGMTLERATGQPVAEYLREKIWKPLGMEYPASWSLDSEKSGFEKMESGINARSIDFAKFGRLFINKGNWNGRQIISEQWVKESTSPNMNTSPDFYSLPGWWTPVFESGENYYKYFWWGHVRKDGSYDFSAEGNRGQLIYVSPSKNLIIVRNGKAYGGVEWLRVASSMADRM